MIPTEQDLARFVVREARLLDEGRLDEWFALFADGGHYWVPLSHGQTDPVLHNSLAYEDTLLLRLRIERLKSPRAFSQQPPSRCHHLLQQPEVDRLDNAANTYVTRTPLLYSETRAGTTLRLAATVYHTLAVIDGALRIRLKRVDLLECETALPSVQLFV
jgi:3-phenylpropionate/cinnamic acid dioxygenase small subunit